MENREWDTALWGLSWDEASRDNAAQGKLNYDDETGAELYLPFGLIRNPSEISLSEMPAKPLGGGKYEWLYGVTRSGVHLALKNSSQTKYVGDPFDFGSQTLQSQVVFESREEFNPSSKINYVEIEYSSMCEWANSCFLEMNNFNVEKLKSNRPLVILGPFELEGIELCFMLLNETNRINSNSINITRHVRCTISLAKGLSFNSIKFNIEARLRSVIAFMVGYFPETLSMRIKFINHVYYVNVYNHVAKSRIKPNPESIALPYEVIGNQLETIIKYWFALEDDELSGVTLLTSLTYFDDMPINLKFIAASSSVEALIRSNYSKLYETHQLKSCIEKAMSAFDKDKDSYLYNRAQSLLGSLYIPSYQMILEKAKEECGDYASAILENWDRFIRNQKRLRNSNVHLVKTHNEYELLVYHFYILLFIGYLVLMNRIGLSDDCVCHFLNGNYKNLMKQSIRQFYLADNS